MGVAEKVTRVPELIKFENSLFGLPFVYIGMLFAGTPTVLKFVLITIALLTARATAFSANRYLGREYDAENPKKRNWANVNLYSKGEMLVIFLAFSAVFIASSYLLNFLAFVLAPLIIVIVLLEPSAKRYTPHRHLLMGAVIGLGIIGAYIGMTGAFPTTLPLYILFLGYVCFSAANDVIYTLSHRDFDKKAGLKTYPTVYGPTKAKEISFFLHMWAGALFAYFGLLILSWPVIVAAVISMFVFTREHKFLASNPKNVIVPFFNYNIAVSFLMLLAYTAGFILPIA